MKRFTHIVLVVNGGAGKNVAATAVTRCLAAAHPDLPIHVVTGWPDIWVSNPHVRQVYRFGRTEQFYDQVMSHGRARVIHVEPYLHDDYIHAERHLIDVWCEMAGVTWDGKPGQIVLSADELAMAREFVAGQPRPALLFAPFAGPPPEQASRLAYIKQQGRMQRRSLPIDLAQKLADTLAANYTVLHARLPEQPQLNNTVAVVDHLRILAALAVVCPKRVLVDSFLQHAAAALDAPAVVCWSGTSPRLLGYDLHRNLVRQACATPTCGRPNSHLFDMTAMDMPWTCPFADACLNHPVEAILQAVEEEVPCGAEG